MPRQLLSLPKAKREKIRALLADDLLPPTEIAYALKISWADWCRLADADPKFKAVLDEAAARDRERLIATLRTSKSANAAIYLLKVVHGLKDEPAGAEKKKSKEKPGGAVGVVVPKARTAAEFAAAAGTGGTGAGK